MPWGAWSDTNLHTDTAGVAVCYWVPAMDTLPLSPPLLEQWLLQGGQWGESTQQDRHEGPAALTLLFIRIVPELGHQLAEELIPQPWLALALPHQVRAQGQLLPGLQGTISKKPQHL